MNIKALLAGALLAICTAVVVAVPAAPAIQAVRVQHPWIRWLPANLPAAGYAVISNDGDRTLRLVGAHSPGYAKVSLHQSHLADGDSSMTPVAHLDIPPHGSVELSPGGYHLMLTHPTRTIRPGQTVTIVLDFAGGPAFDAKFPVMPADTSGPPH